MNLPIPTVFDCTTLAQALINPKGPAGHCLRAAQSGVVRLFVSDYCLQEVRELAGKLPARLGISHSRVDQFVLELGKFTDFVENVPSDFAYQRDPDDAPYVDLAKASAAHFLVTRDKDLLDLVDSASFRNRFPELQIVTPPAFLKVLEEITGQQ